MRMLAIAGLLLLAGCAQPPPALDEAPAADATRLARTPIDDEHVQFKLGSPIEGTCLSAWCMMPVRPESPERWFPANETITAFSFNITLEPVHAFGFTPRFTARCLEEFSPTAPCAGQPDPIASIVGMPPLPWSAGGFAIQPPQFLRLEVQRDGAMDDPLPFQNDAGEGTGDDYRLEGVVKRTSS